MKIKNIHLIIVFIALLVIVFVLRVTSSKKNKGDMITSFFSFTLEDVREFNCYPAHDKEQKMSLKKEKESWKLILADQHIVSVNNEMLTNALGEFEKLKPLRLVSEDLKEFSRYKVDSSGMLLEIITKDNETHYIILGDLTFQNNAYINTYVRIPGEKQVYAAAAYMEGTFKSKPDQWRSREILSIPSGMWTKMEIIYKGNLVKSMVKEDDIWTDVKSRQEFTMADSLVGIIEKFPEMLLANDKFEDDFTNPDLIIHISGADQAESTLSIYQSDEGYFLGSSINQGNYFRVDKDVYEKLYMITEAKL